MTVSGRLQSASAPAGLNGRDARTNVLVHLSRLRRRGRCGWGGPSGKAAYADQTIPDRECFAKRLEKQKGEIFHFLLNPAIEPTNRLGEQAMLPAVVHRKVGGGSRTQRSGDAQGRLLTILQTCVKRAVDYLCRSLRGRQERCRKSRR